MALTPGMHINVSQSQQLKLTPQLQQSIKILQHSALDLQQLVAQTLEENLFLELEEETIPVLSLEQDQPDAPDKDLVSDEPEESAPDSPSEALPDELETDSEWQDVWQDIETIGPITAHGIVNNDDYTAPENYTSEEKNLHDHLRWQVEIYPWKNEQDQAIAEFLIDEINEDGYLQVPLSSLAEAISRQLDTPVSETDIERVLATVQEFDPTGVGARDLRECLLLQLHADPRLDEVTPKLHAQALDLIENHFPLLATHQYRRIQRRYQLDDAGFDQLIHYIQSFDPRPGRAYAPIERSYVIPDLLLHRRGDGLELELNPDAYPRLRLNNEYIELTQRIQDDKQAAILKEKLNEARNLIKSLHHRGETLLRVARFIVERQKRFFEEGERGMQPLVLREVAEALNLHESTISRATNQKFIQTPRGTFELKYFFSAGISQQGEDEQSATAIKSYIREFIDGEDPRKPLSDNKIMQMLEDKGIKVARRTIAKYREAMGIPASSERKRLNYLKARSSR
ncbi:MAG TPA: RNA polymerase factor sigma-54 [Sulfurivirga caldicuralii]|nr:RNA polymerase factor sigma-54 [Sulfurivirga caldicuralii]